MFRRPSACSILVTVAALATASPVRAQSTHFELSGGMVNPTGPTNGNVNAGGQIGVGVLRELSSAPVTLGAEVSFVRFGERELLYGLNLPCPSPGCTASEPGASHLGLINYFATAKYRFGARTVHPYVAAAAGVTQQWSSSTYNGSLQARGLGAGARAGGGVEADLGRVRVGIDVSYATAAGAKYEERLVRYVPVTLRLTF